MMIKTKNKLFVIIAICAFILILASCLYNKMTKFETIEQTDISFELQSNNYYLYKIDSTKINIGLPEFSKNNLEIRISCLDSDFLNRITPIIVKGLRTSSKEQLFNEMQYNLIYKNNLIKIPINKIDDSEFKIRVGYYIYNEIYDGKFNFYNVTFIIKKNNKGEYYATKYTKDDPTYTKDRKNISSVIEIKEIFVYVYQYDIDSFFTGFKDNNNNLLNDEGLVIRLKNGSKYEGSVKNGLFEGKGTFKDNIINKEYKDCIFKKGIIETKDTTSNGSTMVTTERPLLSDKYPVDGCFKTIEEFKDSILIKQTDFYYTNIDNDSKKSAISKRTRTFDNKGNITEQDSIYINND